MYITCLKSCISTHYKFSLKHTYLRLSQYVIDYTIEMKKVCNPQHRIQTGDTYINVRISVWNYLYNTLETVFELLFSENTY